MSLNTIIQERIAAIAAEAPPEVLQSFTDGVAKLVEDDVARNALGVGAKAPDFSLPNLKGEAQRLSSFLSRGPVILQFFRGSWCPFCNIQLSAMEEIRPQVLKLGAEILAVTPELPEQTIEGLAENKPSFPVLHDKANTTSSLYGLTFKLNGHLQNLHQALGTLLLPAANGDDS